MAQFYAEIQGNRSQVSRMGSKQSGMWGHIRGWESGIEVDAVHVDGVDIFHVYQTFGSNGGTKRIFLGTLKDGVFEPAKK